MQTPIQIYIYAARKKNNQEKWPIYIGFADVITSYGSGRLTFTRNKLNIDCCISCVLPLSALWDRALVAGRAIVPQPQNSTTPSEHCHTLRTLPRPQNTTTPSEHYQTLRTLPHPQNITTPSEHYHTLRTLPHPQNTTKPSECFNTMPRNAATASESSRMLQHNASESTASGSLRRAHVMGLSVCMHRGPRLQKPPQLTLD